METASPNSKKFMLRMKQIRHRHIWNLIATKKKEKEEKAKLNESKSKDNENKDESFNKTFSLTNSIMNTNKKNNYDYSSDRKEETSFNQSREKVVTSIQKRRFKKFFLSQSNADKNESVNKSNIEINSNKDEAKLKEKKELIGDKMKFIKLSDKPLNQIECKNLEKTKLKNISSNMPKKTKKAAESFNLSHTLNISSNALPSNDPKNINDQENEALSDSDKIKEVESCKENKIDNLNLTHKNTDKSITNNTKLSSSFSINKNFNSNFSMQQSTSSGTNSNNMHHKRHHTQCYQHSPKIVIKKNLLYSLENSAAGAELQDAVKCYICFTKLDKPKMCPYCHRMACEKCLRKWFNEERKNICGFCKEIISFDKMISVPFMNTVADLVQKVLEEKVKLKIKNYKTNKINKKKKNCSAGYSEEIKKIEVNKSSKFNLNNNVIYLNNKECANKNYKCNNELNNSENNFKIRSNNINENSMNRENKRYNDDESDNNINNNININEINNNNNNNNNIIINNSSSIQNSNNNSNIILYNNTQMCKEENDPQMTANQMPPNQAQEVSDFVVTEENNSSESSSTSSYYCYFEDSSNYCQKHNKEKLYYYCLDCNKSYCRTCFVFFGEEKDKHLNHEIVEYSLYKKKKLYLLTQEKEKLSEKIEEVQKHIKKTESYKNVYEYEKLIFNEQMENIKKKVNKTIDENINKLNEFIEKLTLTINKLKEGKNNVDEYIKLCKKNNLNKCIRIENYSNKNSRNRNYNDDICSNNNNNNNYKDNINDEINNTKNSINIIGNINNNDLCNNINNINNLDNNNNEENLNINDYNTHNINNNTENNNTNSINIIANTMPSYNSSYFNKELYEQLLEMNRMKINLPKELDRYLGNSKTFSLSTYQTKFKEFDHDNIFYCKNLRFGNSPFELLVDNKDKKEVVISVLFPKKYGHNLKHNLAGFITLVKKGDFPKIHKFDNFDKLDDIKEINEDNEQIKDNLSNENNINNGNEERNTIRSNVFPSRNRDKYNAKNLSYSQKFDELVNFDSSGFEYNPKFRESQNDIKNDIRNYENIFYPYEPELEQEEILESNKPKYTNTFYKDNELVLTKKIPWDFFGESKFKIKALIYDFYME